MADFALINPNQSSQPSSYYSSQDDANNTSGQSAQYKQMSGVSRGTQTITNSDGSYVTIGEIPNSSPKEFGIAFFTAQKKLISKTTSTIQYQYDNNSNLIFKATGETQYVYDPTSGKNVMQIGKLPDGTYGFAVAASGHDVSEGY